MTDRIAALELLHIEVGHADPTCLAFTDELQHRPPRVLECRAGHPVGPVELVQVDALQAKATKASLALLADRLGSQIVLDDSLGSRFPPATAFREDEHVLADAVGRQRASDHLLPAGRGRRRQRCRSSSRPARSARLIALIESSPLRRPIRTATARRSPMHQTRRSTARGAGVAQPTKLHARDFPIVEVARHHFVGAHPSMRCALALEIAEVSSRIEWAERDPSRSTSNPFRPERVAADRVRGGDVEDLVAGEIRFECEDDRVAEIVDVDVGAGVPIKADGSRTIGPRLRS